MSHTRPLFIADSCIGGLSVLRSIWATERDCDVEFLADYAINPLGVKSDAAIAEVSETWLQRAAQGSEALVIGCNTLSIRFHQLHQPEKSSLRLRQIVSMVDCFQAMMEAEATRMKDCRVLIIGTTFTASQSLYPDLLTAAILGVDVSTIAATELERSVARFQPWIEHEVITAELREALESADFAVLACTCFPIVASKLEILFPEVEFLDPGAYCANLLDFGNFTENRSLNLTVTGEEVSQSSVATFAKDYLQPFTKGVSMIE